jgi:primosomal protein N'
MAKILSFLREQLQKKEHLWQSILMLEGTPAPYHRLRGLYRYQVIIKYLDNNFQQEMEDIVGEAKQKGERQSTCLLELDAQDII